MRKCPAPDKLVHLERLTRPTESETWPLENEMQLCFTHGCGFDAMSSRRAWHLGLGPHACVLPAGSVACHTHTCSASVITELLLLGRGWPEAADRSPTESNRAAWQATGGGACAGVAWLGPAAAPTPLADVCLVGGPQPSPAQPSPG